MLFLFISVIVLGLLLCGAGCLFGKILRFASLPNPILYFWLGFFIIGTLSMFCSLFVPLNLISLIIFFIIGGIGLPFFYRAYKQSIAQYGSTEIKLFKYTAFFVLFILVCLSAYTAWPGKAYDTDLYHAQAIRWYNEYGTPPGLGNLHARLAFNSLWLSLAALFDNGIWDNRSPWLMPILGLLGGFFYFLYELFFAKKNGARVYALCILAWLSLSALRNRFSPGLYYDDPVHILNAVIVLEAYYLLSNDTKNLTQQKINGAMILLMLSVSAFMIKPIGAVSLFFSGLLTLFLLIRNTKQSILYWFKIYIPSLCAFGIWITKNIFLSGYLIYPLPIFMLPLDWSMTFEAVKSNYDAVLAWARMPGPDYLKSLENGFLFWFTPWLTSNLHSIVFLILIALPSCLSFILWFLVIRYKYIKKAAFFLIWTLFSISYWFLTAPDVRFGAGFFWVCLGEAFLFFVPGKSHLELSGLWKISKIRLIFFCLWGLGIIAGAGLNVVSSKRNLLSIGSIPSRPVKQYTVNAIHSFSVWIPDGNDDRTGNSPLPSAPGILKNLEMREPGNLKKGFRPERR